MEWTDALILGILQGITEFLPISSSGHLVLAEHHLGLNVASLKSFDVLVHAGTLLAIIIYFWKDIWGMIKSFFLFIGGRLKADDPYLRLIFYIIIGSVPAALLGIFGEEWIDSVFRNPFTVGISMFVMGIVFLLGEFTFRKVHNKAPISQKIVGKVDGVREMFQPGGFESKEIRGMNWYKAIIIGLAQAVALVPGISRSGSTIVAGLFQGVDRSSAARFSFLLGTPAIFGAALLTGLKIPGNGGMGIEVIPAIIGFVSSFIIGLISVAFLMQFLKRHSLIVFSVYLIALGFSVFV